MEAQKGLLKRESKGSTCRQMYVGCLASTAQYHTN